MSKSLSDLSKEEQEERKKRLSEWKDWRAGYKKKIEDSMRGSYPGEEDDTWKKWKKHDEARSREIFLEHRHPGGEWELEEINSASGKYMGDRTTEVWRWVESDITDFTKEPKEKKFEIKSNYERGSSIPDEFKYREGHRKAGQLKSRYKPIEVEIDEEQLIKEGTLKPITDTELAKPSRKNFNLGNKIKNYAASSKDFKLDKTANRSFAQLKKDIKSNPFKKKN